MLPRDHHGLSSCVMSSYAGTTTVVSSDPPLPTFMDHFRELQGRLFVVAISFIVFSAAAYPFFDQISRLLTAPLRPDQQLIYLTPGGAFSFIIKVCMYVGAIFSLPIIIYNVYRFVMPAVRPVRMRTALVFTIASLFLAVCGILFAYFVSLPASLYFLTSFNLHNIQAMLTIDSYFSFVMVYLLAGSLLFQVPLVMLMINTITPLSVGKLMSYQRYMVVGSFVVAAVISPTPDAINQTLLAAPVVVMYQLGILMIWHKNRHRRIKKSQSPVPYQPPQPLSQMEPRTDTDEHERYLEHVLADMVAPSTHTVASTQHTEDQKPHVAMPHQSMKKIRIPIGGVQHKAAPLAKTQLKTQQTTVSIDGMTSPVRSRPQISPASPHQVMSSIPVGSRMSTRPSQTYRVMRQASKMPAAKPRLAKTNTFRAPSRQLEDFPTRRIQSRQISM